MPLLQSQTTPENGHWALWHITESLEALQALLPIQQENQQELAQIHFEPRRKEWFAGRLAAQVAAGQQGMVYQGIQKDQWGKPWLKQQPAHLSISNSSPYAVAIIHPNSPVGIDIEFPKPALQSIKTKFLSTTELQDAGTNLDKLCVYWCAKETLYKIHGTKKLAFKGPLKVQPFTLQNQGYLQGSINDQEHYSLFYQAINDHWMVYSIGS